MFFYSRLAVDDMTSKLHKLNPNPRRLFHNSSKYLKSIGIFLVILPSQSALAHNLPESEQKLPPPPPLNQKQVVKRSIPITIDGKLDRNSKRQYNFERSLSLSYRVEVYDESQPVLSQVKKIVPSAFRNSGVIQVGIFQEPKNAEDLVLQLTSLGFWARIVTVDR